MNYKSIDTIEINGRGKVFLVENEKDRQFDCCDLIGEKVLIDGDEYTVKGIEKFCLPIIKKGQTIGILV